MALAVVWRVVFVVVVGELVALSGLDVTLVFVAEASAGLVWSTFVLVVAGLTVGVTVAGIGWLMTGVTVTGVTGTGDLTFGAMGVGLGANGTGVAVLG